VLTHLIFGTSTAQPGVGGPLLAELPGCGVVLYQAEKSSCCGVTPRSSCATALAVAAAVMAGGATAAHAPEDPGPSMILNGTTIDIAAMGPANTLDFYWAGIGTGSWNPETVTGTDTDFSAPSILLSSTSAYVEVTAAGLNNSLMLYLKVIGSGGWSSETVAPACSVG